MIHYVLYRVLVHSKKSFEGLFAGGFITFIIAFLILIGSQEVAISILTATVMALVASLLFMILDCFTLKISYNIMKPLICGAGMLLVFLFL